MQGIVKNGSILQSPLNEQACSVNLIFTLDTSYFNLSVWFELFRVSK